MNQQTGHFHFNNKRVVLPQNPLIRLLLLAAVIVLIPLLIALVLLSIIFVVFMNTFFPGKLQQWTARFVAKKVVKAAERHQSHHTTNREDDTYVDYEIVEDKETDGSR